MSKLRFVLPLALAGLVMGVAFATAGPGITAAAPSKVASEAARPQTEVEAMFDVTSMTIRKPTPPDKAVTVTDAALQKAEVDALFAVAPMSVRKQTGPAKDAADAAQQDAEVAEMFAVAPLPLRKQAGPAKNIQSERGREVYLGLCFACHMPDGKGLANVFPPLAGSDYLMADRDRAIRILLKGLVGPVKVNGVTYNSAMPALDTTLTDQHIADVLTYVTGEWGNQGAPYTLDDVRRIKQGTVTPAPP